MTIKRKLGIAGLVGAVLFGCATADKDKKAVEQPQIKTPEQVTIDYNQSMVGLKDEKKKEAGKYETEFQDNIRKYNEGTAQIRDETKKIYEQIREAVNKEIERIENEKKEEIKRLREYQESLPTTP